MGIHAFYNTWYYVFLNLSTALGLFIFAIIHDEWMLINFNKAMYVLAIMCWCAFVLACVMFKLKLGSMDIKQLYT